MEGKGRAFVSAVVFICFFSRCSAGPESNNNNKNELGLRVSFSVLPLATLYLLASFDIWLFSGGGLQQQARQGLDLLIGRRGGYSSFAVCILFEMEWRREGKRAWACKGWMGMNGLE